MRLTKQYMIMETNMVYQNFQTKTKAILLKKEIKDFQPISTDDLEGSDDRYNKGTHSSTFFSIHCHTDQKEGFPDSKTEYRTKKTINDGIIKYKQAIDGSVKLRGLRPLQFSKGIKGVAPDPYPGCSRVIPPSVHIDMGITAKMKKIN
eukprot:88696_1